MKKIIISAIAIASLTIISCGETTDATQNTVDSSATKSAQQQQELDAEMHKMEQTAAGAVDSLVNQTKEGAKAIGEGVKEGAKEIGKGVKDGVQKAGQEIKEAGKDLKNDVKNAVK